MQTTGNPGGDEPLENGDDFDLPLDEPEEIEETETEDEPEPIEAPEPVEQPPAAQPRRAGRKERQAAEIRSLRERNERLERDFAAFRQQQQARPAGPDPAELARREQAEREHVATLDYSQQMAYWRDKDRRDFQQQLQQTQLGIAQQLDKSTWDASARVDPMRARFADRVEDLLRSEMAAGRMQSREVLYHYLLGQEADRARTTRGNGQRQAAARRVAAQTIRPGGVRSDGAAPARRPTGDSYEAAMERVKGQSLW